MLVPGIDPRPAVLSEAHRRRAIAEGLPVVMEFLQEVDQTLAVNFYTVYPEIHRQPVVVFSRSGNWWCWWRFSGVGCPRGPRGGQALQGGLTRKPPVRDSLRAVDLSFFFFYTAYQVGKCPRQAAPARAFSSLLYKPDTRPAVGAPCVAPHRCLLGVLSGLC